MIVTCVAQAAEADPVQGACCILHAVSLGNDEVEALLCFIDQDFLVPNGRFHSEVWISIPRR